MKSLGLKDHRKDSRGSWGSLNRAKIALVDLLGTGSELPVQTVEDAVGMLGVSLKTLKKARVHLGWGSRKVGKRWVWVPPQVQASQVSEGPSVAIPETAQDEEHGRQERADRDRDREDAALRQAGSGSDCGAYQGSEEPSGEHRLSGLPQDGQLEVPCLPERAHPRPVQGVRAMGGVATAQDTPVELGLRCGGPRAGPRVKSDYLAELFPHPTFDEMRTAIVPHPPKIPEASDTKSAVEMIVRSYRGAVEHRTGKRCWSCPKDVVKSKFYSSLAAGAQEMRSREIAPAAWSLFSYDVWNSERNGEKRENPCPPLVWVYAPKRIIERYGWFKGVCGNELGRRVVPSPEQIAFFVRYTGMQRALWRSGVTLEMAQAAVRGWFPEGREAALRVVTEGNIVQQQLLDRRMAAGDWLWL